MLSMIIGRIFVFFLFFHIIEIIFIYVGGKLKLSRVVDNMKERNNKMKQYNKELRHETITKRGKAIDVEKMYEILEYILRMANYPMEPSVAGDICIILDDGMLNCLNMIIL